MRSGGMDSSLLAGLSEGAEVTAVTPNGSGDWAYVEYVDRDGTKHCRGVCTCGGACPCHGRKDYY